MPEKPSDKLLLVGGGVGTVSYTHLRLPARRIHKNHLVVAACQHSCDTVSGRLRFFGYDGHLRTYHRI